MRVIVTGGSGFIGTNLIELLLRHGHSVLNLDINPPRNEDHLPFWNETSLLDRDVLGSALAGFSPDVIYHLAARTDLNGTSLEDYEVNIGGTENLINEAAKIPSVSYVLFASSRLVCRIGYQPKHDEDYCASTIYGESKVLSEQIVRSKCKGVGFKWALFRPTSIWGPWFDTPYREFFLSVLKRRYVHPKGLKISKSFGYVGNSVHILASLVENGVDDFHKKTFYLCDYPVIDVLDWANEISSQVGSRPIVEVPLFLLRIVARCGDLFHFIGWKNVPLTTFRLNNLLTPMPHETKFIEELIGDLPFSNSEGVSLTLSWLSKERH